MYNSTPKGKVIIAVPNHESQDAQIYQEHWAAYDVPRHLYHFSPKSIIHLVEKFGFTHEQTLPMKFDSYYVSILSENYLNPNKGTIRKLINAFINGYKSNTWAKKNNNNYSSLLFILKKK